MHAQATGSQAKPRADRREDAVWWATRLGIALTAVGLVDGLVMALERRVADCPNGTYFPEGATDFNCYVHPQAGLGIAIAVFSLLLGILVLLASMAARASLEAQSPTS